MTTHEAIKTISSLPAVEEVTLAAKAETSIDVDFYWIMLKDGRKFGDGTHNWFVSEGTMKKIATLIAI